MQRGLGMIRQSGLILAYAVSILLGFNPAFTQAKPHEHGVAQLEISLSGNELQLRFVSALDSFLGWERAPRNDQEKMLYRQLRQDLAQFTSLLSLPAQAACSLQQAQVSDPHQLENKATQAMAKQESEHQDVVVEWSIRCEQPSQLKRTSFQGFDRYKRLRRIDVQYNLPSGMGKARLTSRQRDLQLP